MGQVELGHMGPLEKVKRSCGNALSFIALSLQGHAPERNQRKSRAPELGTSKGGLED